MNHRNVVIFAAILGLAWSGLASANAVLIEGAEGEVVRTLSQDIQIQVRAQVATTTVTTHFAPLSESHALFCIGVPDQAAAYELVMIVDGEEIAADTAVGDPGEIPDDMTGWIAQDLVAYLGENPLRTWVHGMEPGTQVTFRLTYVELLPYSFGLVTYTFPMVPFAGDTEPVEELTIDFELLTERTIESFSINPPRRASMGYPCVIWHVPILPRDRPRPDHGASVCRRGAGAVHGHPCGIAGHGAVGPRHRGAGLLPDGHRGDLPIADRLPGAVGVAHLLGHLV